MAAHAHIIKSGSGKTKETVNTMQYVMYYIVIQYKNKHATEAEV